MAGKADNLSFGKYRLVAELGSGGMGDVFLAVALGPKGFNKLQVIKSLRTELAEDEEFLAMFLNEARLAARLNHPNVVQTNEVGEEGGAHFIAMEYLEGQSLHTVLRRAQGSFPLAMHVRVIAEACAGLHHAHELLDFDGTPLSVVHRDCTPQNVFITYDGGVKVLDFGIAKAADSSATLTRTGVLKGKVPYMAPEQLEGHQVDRRADIFAVGAMLWEAAAGTRLWKGLNDVQIAHRVHLGDVPSPRAANPDVNDRLEAIAMRCLAMDPDERYPTAAALQQDLELLTGELGGATTRDVGKWVAQAFVETRRQLRSRIEQELKAVLPGRGSASEAPLWKSGESTASRSGEHPVGAPSTPPTPIAPRRPDPVALPQEQAAAFEDPTTQATLPSISLLPDSTRDRSALAGEPTDPGRRRRAYALLLGACAIASVVIILAVRAREPPPPITDARPNVVPTGSPAVVTAALTFALEPAHAKFYVDGKEVASPLTMPVGREFVVRAEAKGFVPRTEKVTLSLEGRALLWALEPEAKKGEKPAASAASLTNPKAPIATKPTLDPMPLGSPSASASTSAKGKPTLDRDDPWQK